MEKLKFFTGTPDDISREYEVWRTENLSSQILGRTLTMSQIVIPAPPDPNVFVHAGPKPPVLGQIVTVLFLMVAYEDLSRNPS